MGDMKIYVYQIVENNCNVCGIGELCFFLISNQCWESGEERIFLQWRFFEYQFEGSLTCKGHL